MKPEQRAREPARDDRVLEDRQVREQLVPAGTVGHGVTSARPASGRRGARTPGARASRRASPPARRRGRGRGAARGRRARAPSSTRWVTMTTAASWRARSALDQLHDLLLGGDVQRRRRLVEHEQRRAAGDRARDQHALPLAARQVAQLAAREIGGVDLVERGARGVAIGAARQSDEAPRSLPAHEHELARPRSGRSCRARSAAARSSYAGRARARRAPRPARCSPSSVRTNVDLPAPLGPMTAHSSPRAIVGVDRAARCCACRSRRVNRRRAAAGAWSTRGQRSLVRRSRARR